MTSAIRPIVRPFQGLPETIQPITELVTIIQERQVTALVTVRGKRSNHLGDAKDIVLLQKNYRYYTTIFTEAASLLVSTPSILLSDELVRQVHDSLDTGGAEQLIYLLLV